MEWFASRALPAPSTRGVKAFWVRGLGRYFTVTTLPGGRGAIVRPRLYRTAAEVRDDALRPPLR